MAKTNTNFFSDKGKYLLQRIWLDNNLDEEMIFASWIGPSRPPVRQKVSDYMQAFNIRRSALAPVRKTDIISKLRRYSVHFSATHRDTTRNSYFDSYKKAKSKQRQELRENGEKRRIEKSIGNGNLQAIPGFEYVLKHPIYRAQQLEKRMQSLQRIPLPYNEAEFEKYVLPILTAAAISNEESKVLLPEKGRKLLDLTNDSKSFSKLDSSSGFSEESDEAITDEIAHQSDSDLIQVFSEMDLSQSRTHSELDETLADVCEICGGLMNHSQDEDLDGLGCTCVPEQVWEGRRVSSAAALYEEASKIARLYIREHLVSAEFMEQFAFKTWLN